jgi:hypothetical protein
LGHLNFVEILCIMEAIANRSWLGHGREFFCVQGRLFGVDSDAARRIGQQRYSTRTRVLLYIRCILSAIKTSTQFAIETPRQSIDRSSAVGGRPIEVVTGR